MALAIDTDGRLAATSSLVIVPVAVAVPNLAPTGRQGHRERLGRPDSGVTPITETFTFCEVTSARRSTCPTSPCNPNPPSPSH